MIALLLCVLALVTTLKASKYSLAAGLIAVISWGYFYGILRANFPQGLSFVIFDVSVLAFYWANRKRMSSEAPRLKNIKTWIFILLAWPAFLVFLPLQDPLISLIGLRGNVFFLPMLLIGALLTSRDLLDLSLGLAVLNCLALGFGVAEYFLGLERFFPVNPVTFIIYASNDVAGYQYFRIPSTFGTAHLYGGAMVTSLPFLFSGWISRRSGDKTRWLILLGICSGLFGVLLSATRLHLVVAVVVSVTLIIAGSFSMKSKLWVVAALILIGMAAVNNERFGRFKSLGETDRVADRIHGSVNRSFFEIMTEFPMGNGLGGGGTSIPFFLRDNVRHPIAMENEYCRILLETGIIGLALWLGFILWFLFGSHAFAKSPWSGGRRTAWVCCLCYFGIGLIGTGMLTSVPQTLMMFLAVGWVAAKPLVEKDAARFGQPQFTGASELRTPRFTGTGRAPLARFERYAR